MKNDAKIIFLFIVLIIALVGLLVPLYNPTGQITGTVINKYNNGVYGRTYHLVVAIDIKQPSKNKDIIVSFSDFNKYQVEDVVTVQLNKITSEAAFVKYKGKD